MNNTDIFATEEYRTAFYKDLLNKPLEETEQRALETAEQTLHAEKRLDGFNTVTTNAQVIPTLTLNEVVRKARTQGGLLAEARGFNIPSNLKIPVGTPLTKAEWHTEGSQVDAEQVETARIKFGSYEVMKVFSMSISTKKMSIQAFESYLIDELVSTVLEAIEDAIANGDGIDKGEGILSIDFTEENTVNAEGKYSDFTQALAKLKRGYAGNAKFVMNNSTLYGEVYGMVDVNGRPIFIDDPKNESIGRILGKEVIVDDHLPDGTIILGDFKYYGVNIPDGIMVETSRESSFRSGLIDYRAVAVADCKPLVEEAFVKIEATP